MTPLNLQLFILFSILLQKILSSGFVLMNLTSNEFVMLKIRRLDSQSLSYKLKANKSVVTLPDGKERIIEFPLNWNATLSLGIDVFNSDGDHLVSLEIHRRPNSRGSDWQKDVISAQKAKIQVAYKYECDKNFYGERCELKCASRLANARCDEHGRLDCKKGWTGRNCQIKIDVPPCPCQNGGDCELLTNGRQQCKCPLQFVGQFCERQTTASNQNIDIQAARLKEYYSRFSSSQLAKGSIDKVPDIQDSDNSRSVTTYLLLFFLLSIIIVQCIYIVHKCRIWRKPRKTTNDDNGIMRVQKVFTVEKDVELSEKLQSCNSDRCQSPEVRYSVAPTKTKFMTSNDDDDFQVIDFGDKKSSANAQTIYEEPIYAQIVMRNELPFTICDVSTT